jgi:hypothetical protein
LYDAFEKQRGNFLWPRQWNAIKYKIDKTSHKIASKNYLSVYADNLKAKNPDVTFKVLVNDIIERETHNLTQTNSIVVTASSGNKEKQKVQIALQLKNGQVFGKVIELTSEAKGITIPYSELKPVQMVLLPRPFPPFQSYFMKSLENSNFDAKSIEALQISIGPEIKAENYSKNQQVLIYKILLQ